MTVTNTLIAGPFNMGPKLKIAVYQCALDTAHATGGEVVDLTGEFDFIYAAWVAGNDTASDNGLGKFDFVLPTATTAVSSSNVLITNYWSPDGTDGEAFKENTGDVAVVGQMSYVVIGS